ncbi:MAG: PAS domain S-box protein [Thermoanaerobaculales bacterium]
MTGMSIPPLVMASIDAYVGVHHLAIYARMRQSRQHLTFALLALSVAGYCISAAGLYNAAAPENGRSWQIAEVVFLALGAPVMMLFFADYTGPTRRRFVRVVTAGFAAVALAALVGGSDLIFSHMPAIKHTTLPFGLSVTYQEVAAGPLMTILSILALSVFAFGFAGAVGLDRRGERSRATRLGIASALFFFGFLNDALMALGLIRSIYTLEYAFLGLVVLMADGLVSDLARSAKIEESLELLKHSIDIVSDAAFWTAPDGRFVYVNEAACKSVGYARDELLHMRVSDINPKAHPERWAEVWEALRTSKAVRLESVHRRKDGSEFPVEILSTFVTFGERDYSCGFARDITERTQAEETLRASEAQLRALFAAINDVILVLDGEGRYVSIAPTNPALLYRPAEELIGKRMDEVFPPEQAEFFRAHVRRALESRQSVSLEYSLPIGGREVFFSATLSPMLADQVVLVARDITEQRRLRYEQAAMYEISEATQATGSLEELFRSIHAIIGRLMAAENFYIALYDPATNLLSFPYFVDEVDEAPAPFPLGLGMTSYVVRSGQSLLATPEVLTELETRGEIESLGSPSIDWLGAPLKVHDRVIGVLAVQSYAGNVRYGEADKEVLTYVSTQVAQAIERKQAEDAFREDEERFHGAFDGAATGMALVGPDGRWLKVNRALCEIVGYAEPELLTKRFQDLTHPDDLPRDLNARLKLLAGEIRGYQTEKRYFHKDGHVVWVFLSVSLVRDSVGRPLYFVSHFSDLTDRKRAEEALRHSEERYRTILQTIVEGYFEVDVRGNMTFCNDSMAKLLGYTREDLMGLNNRAYMDEDNAKRVYQAFNQVYRTGAPAKALEWELIRRDGTRIVVENSVAPLHDDEGRPAGFRGLIRDITERKRLEEQLMQAQKLEAIGRLAGGIAHDFNNLLQVLLSQVQLLHARSSGREREEAVITEIEQGIKRGASLTRQLLLFSRHETPRPERLDLNQVVSEAGALLRPLLRENIAMARDLSPQPLLVQGDRGQLEQVLLNLAINAADAMPEGGRLTLRTVRSGDEEVSLEVCDTGTGIPPEVRDHLFEPFFTTKSPDRGTGLGLSVVHGIIAQHDGRIEVDSAVGRGSTFRVVLPNAVLGEYPAAATVVENLAPLADGRGERVLVVEDEEAARDALRGILTSLGYEVVTAGSGEDAGRLPVEEPFDVLLTDVMLPGIAGPELAHGLEARWPGLRVILMSGYTEDEAVRRGIATGKVRFLQKPFDMATLAQEIRAVLSHPS